MPDGVSPQAVLQAIVELRQWLGELGQVAGTLSDFAFKWAEQNGGIPKTKAARNKLLADYRARFNPQPDVPDEQAMQAMEERYQAWAKGRGIETATPADLQRFDDETGVLTRRIDELSGFTGPKDLAQRIGVRCEELARAALAMGCDDATAAALNGVAALAPDIAEGRAVLDSPATWTEARRQANAMFQSEAIAGIPLNRAWEVALDRLEQAALSQAEASAVGKPQASHSADFTFVHWYGTEYTFALGVQSSAVKVLWSEWEATGLGLHQGTIRNAIDTERDNFRMDTAFRGHPALGTMIQPCGDGKYKLNPPSASKAPTAPKGKKSAKMRRNHA